jgi:acetoin utilization protein AcuB
LLIRDWLKSPLYTVKPRDSVAHARALLAEYRINQLPVVRDQRLIGLVTDRDLRDAPETVAVALAITGKGSESVLPDPAEIHVEDVMTANVLTLGPEDTVERAAEVMIAERIGSLPIVEKRRLVGILTRSDVLRAFLSLSAGRETGEKRRERRAAPRPKKATSRSKPPRRPKR